MSKKSKRQVRKQPASEGMFETSQTFTSPTASRGPVFNPDYTHVIKDLRRIGILAASFVAILIVLTLVLPK